MYVIGNEVLARIAYHERLKLNQEGLFYRYTDQPDAKGEQWFQFLTSDPLEICAIFGINGQAYTDEKTSNIESFKLLQQSPYVLNYHYRYVNEFAGDYMKSFTAYMKTFPVAADKPRRRITLDTIDAVLPYLRIKELVKQYEHVQANQHKISNLIGEVFKYLVGTGFEKQRFPDGLEKLNAAFLTYWGAKYFILTHSVQEIGEFIREQLD